MSALTEMQPYFDKYQSEIRKAKNASGYTLPELSELSGVPYSNVCDINAGRVKSPSLFYAAALCKVLGLSLNRIMGLDEPTSTDGQQSRIHELELEAAKQDEKIQFQKRLNDIQREQLATCKAVISALAGVCALLVCALIGYMIWDATLTTAGLFQSTGTSVLALVLIAVILGAVAVITYAFYTQAKNRLQ